MADCLSSGFPDVFLRIELWTGKRELEQLQSRIISQKNTDRFATMPGSVVKEQQNWLSGKSGEQRNIV